MQAKVAHECSLTANAPLWPPWPWKARRRGLRCVPSSAHTSGGRTPSSPFVLTPLYRSPVSLAPTASPILPSRSLLRGPRIIALSRLFICRWSFIPGGKVPITRREIAYLQNQWHTAGGGGETETGPNWTEMRRGEGRASWRSSSPVANTDVQSIDTYFSSSLLFL